MADFIIPQGREFQFTLKIIEKDSFLAQDVETLDEVNSTLDFREYLSGACVTKDPGEITLVKVADDTTEIEVATYADLPVDGAYSVVYVTLDDSKRYMWNGVGYDEVVSGSTYRGGAVKVTLASTYTAKMNPRRGDIVDGLYLKPAYEAVLTVKFTDPEIPTRTVLIDNIYVVPASC